MSGFGPTPVYADPDNINTNMVGVKYGALDKILANFHLAMQNNVTRMLASGFNSNPSFQNLVDESAKKGRRLTHDEARAVLFPQPASPEEVEAAKKDRPGIDIPEGVSGTTLKMITDRNDSNAYWNYQAQQPAGTAATYSGYGAGLVFGLADPVALMGGGVVGGAAKRLVVPAAAKWVATLEAGSYAGAGAAKVATNIATSSLTGGAGFAGYTAFQEAGNAVTMANLGQTPQYQQAVQNVWHGFKVGAVLGGLGGTAGELMGTKHFDNISAATKEKVGKYYRPWSQEAEQTARVDATAQMVDGKMPNVKDIIDMGEIEEGHRFRETLKQNNVDLPKFSAELEDSKASIATEINTLNKGNVFEEPMQNFATEARDVLRENPELIHDARDVIDGFKKTLNLTDREAENLYTAISHVVPERSSTVEGRRVTEGQIFADLKKKGEAAAEPTENIQRRLKMERHIAELQEIAEHPDTHPTAAKKALQYAAKLNDNLPEMRSPTDELAAIRQKIMPEGVPVKNFRRTAEYKRLQQLAKGSHLARNMLVESHLSSPLIVRRMAENLRNARINELYDQWHMADSMQRHVDGTHEPTTQASRKAYFDHLKSSGLEDIDYTLPDAEAKIDETLAKFGDGYIKNLAEMIEKPELAEGWEELKTLEKQQPTFRSIAKALTDCIMKGVGA
jgi:hypothetical protein